MNLKALLLATTTLMMTGQAWADIAPTVDTVITNATDLRSLTFGAEGKIYATGNVNFVRADLLTVVLRLNADGTPDLTFGDKGQVIIDVSDTGTAVPENRRRQQSFGVVELADGSIRVIVHALDAQSGQSAYLLKFNHDGSQVVGPEWGDDQGRVEIVFGWANADNANYTGKVGPVDSAWNLWVDPTNPDRVIVTGHGPAPGGTDLDRYMVRLNAADGAPDTTFNGGAPVHYSSLEGVVDNNRRSSVTADGSIVSAGFTEFEGAGMSAVILKVLSDGTFDPAFGNFAPEGVEPRPGVAVINPFNVDGGMSEAYAAVALSDGSIVTSGPGDATAEGGTSTLGYKASTGGDLVSFRVNGNALDATYGGTGAVVIQSEGIAENPSDTSAGAVVLPDNRVVHAGEYGGHAAVFVTLPDGSLDTSVSTDGIIELPHDTVDIGLNEIQASADGSRVVVSSDVHELGSRIVVLDIE